jgi:enamine deaminase RidA (YjgF/YER057c/UK114 family)
LASDSSVVRVNAEAPYPAYADRGGFRFLSGLAVSGSPIATRTGDSLVELAEAPYRAQATAIYEQMRQMLRDVGGLSALLRQHMFQEAKRQFPVLESIRIEFEGDTPAPSSGIGINLMRGDPQVTYEIDGIALSPEGLAVYGRRTKLDETGMGPPAAHYTQAVKAGPYVFLAGMIPIDPVRSKAILGFDDVPSEGRWLQRNRSHPDSRTGPIAAQAWSLYTRILTTLESQGIPPGGVCVVTVFLQDAGDFADALRVHHSFFGDLAPALQVVVVDEVGHRGTLIEIECTATTDEITRSMSSQPMAEAPDLTMARDLAYISDQVGLGDDGILCRDLDDFEQVPRKHRSALDSLSESFSREEKVLVAQSYAALRRLLSALERGEMNVENLGHLLIRIRRPLSIEPFEAVRKLLMGEVLPAVTVLRSAAIAQSHEAVVAVSAACGRAESVKGG